MILTLPHTEISTTCTVTVVKLTTINVTVFISFKQVPRINCRLLYVYGRLLYATSQRPN